ncbi:MAG: dTDP-4-dehydrorhamnose reductase [Chloroflexota bacterium]
MHILIVGSNGQLGTALQTVYSQTLHIVTTWARPTHDITVPTITRQLVELQPDVVINAAAWTNVDGAEDDPQLAYAANALGPKYLAEGCAQCGALMVQVSTNEVFAGAPGQFYREYDQPNPGGVYASSKLAGETAARQVLDRLIIARVSWLYGPTKDNPGMGNNFPSKIREAADKFGELRVVNDEFGTPTYALDAAQAIQQLVELGRVGIYHIVNDGCASRYDVAALALQTSGRGDVPLTPIPLTEWPRPVMPPYHAVLVNEAAAALGVRLRPWQEALSEYVATWE